LNFEGSYELSRGILASAIFTRSSLNIGADIFPDWYDVGNVLHNAPSAIQIATARILAYGGEIRFDPEIFGNRPYYFDQKRKARMYWGMGFMQLSSDNVEASSGGKSYLGVVGAPEIESRFLLWYSLIERCNPMPTPITMNPSEETITIGPLSIHFLLTGEDTNGSVSVFEVMVPAGQKLAAPAHKNDAYEEILYGIKGVLTWTINGDSIEIGPGQAVCIPPGAVHRFDNFGTEDAKQLVVISPAIMSPAYFREASAVLNAAAGGAPDIVKMVEVFRRHGMTIAPP
jgi:quercetin dioxygenase-like cupin family protein